MILKRRKVSDFADFSGKMMIVGYEAHVVGIHGTEGSEAITHNSKEGDKDVVDYVYNIVFS